MTPEEFRTLYVVITERSLREVVSPSDVNCTLTVRAPSPRDAKKPDISALNLQEDKTRYAEFLETVRDDDGSG